MGIKMVDTAEPMNENGYPVARAKHIWFDDSESLQKKLDNGSLSGDGSGYTQLSQAEYDALTEDEKMNGKEYRTYDTGHIYKLGVEYGKDAYFTSLSQLGLTGPTTVGEVFVAMPDKSMLMLNVEALVDDGTNVLTVTDVPKEFGLLTIEKYAPGRHRIEYSSSLGGSASDVRKWIGSIKGNDGTGLRWIELTGSAKIYTTMAQLGLDGATATVQDVMDAISVGETAMLRSDAFNNNNWQTQCNGIQYGYLKIEKTMNNLSNIELQEVVAPNRRYFGTQASGKFAGWTQATNTRGLVSNAQNFKIDLTKNNASWYGMFMFNLVYGTTPCEITVAITDKVYYTITKGLNLVSALTYTQSGANYTIGIDLTAKVYGTQVVDMPREFGTINSLTAEQFAGDTTAISKGQDCNEIIYTSLSGNLAGITTVLDLVNALVTEYRALSSKKPIRFVSGEITKTTLTDLPRNYGLLQITVFGYDVVEVSFAGSSFGFKTLHYGFVNRTSGEALFSSLFWEIVDTPVTELIDLGLDGSATIQNVMDVMTIGQHCILNTSRFDDKTQVDNIEYGKVEIRRLSSGMWSLWLEDVLHGNVVAHGTCSNGKFAGWHYFTTKSYVDNLIADLQAQIDALK